MTRQLFTAADIRHLARDLKSTLLVVGADDLVTPEAADLAKELGVRLIRESAAAGSERPRPEPFPAPLPPLKVVKGAGVAMEPFGAELATPGANVRLKDVITSDDGSSM